MTRAARTIPVLLVVLTVVAVAWVAKDVPGQDSVEWIVSLQPNQAYMYQPIVFKAYAHNPVTQTMYRVRCNLTITNATDVVLYDRVDGRPAVRYYILAFEGTYSFRAYCVREAKPDEVYTYTATVTVSYPTPTIEYEVARWGRHLNLTVRAPYPYTGYPVDVVYGGTVYNGTLREGAASFTLPPITKPETIAVKLFGKVSEYTVTPEPPLVKLVTEADVAKAGSALVFRVELEDDLGALGYRLPVHMSAEGDCNIQQQTYYTGVAYKAQVSVSVATGTCLLVAEVEPWAGTKVSASKVIQVVPQDIVNYEFRVSNTTNWDYSFVATVALDSPTAGTLTLYINGAAVANDSGTRPLFAVAYSANLKPGSYAVKVVFRYTGGELVLADKVIVVPKYRYTIVPPPPVVYAGDHVTVPNADYYAVYVNVNTLLVHAIFHGNETHEPASGLFAVRVVYPEIELTEHSISVRNGAPGALVEVFCVVRGTATKIVELYLMSGSIQETFPPWLDCDQTYAVYRRGSYEQVAFANEPEPVRLLTTECRAGEPCTLLAPSDRIVSARVGLTHYVPGTPVRLAPGVYTLYVTLSDGHVLHFTVHVAEVDVKVYAWQEGEGWVVKVEGPAWAKVRVSLASGLTLELGVGVHTLFSEPVSVCWQYGRVELVKYGLVR